jgi:hypothetical protein
MVGKFYVPTSRMQLLAPGINNVVGQMMEARQGDLSDKRQQAMRQASEQWMAQRPQPTMREQPGPPTEEGVGPAPKEVPVTPEARLAWAMQGQRNPLSRALATKYAEDQLIQEPVRAEARKGKIEDLEDLQAARKEQYEANIAFKMDQLKEQARQADVRSADARQSAADREQARQDSLELRRQGVALQSQLFEYRKQHDQAVMDAKKEADKAKLDATGKKMSDKARSELDKQDAATKALNEGIEMLDAAPSKGTGYVPGLVTDFVPGGQSLVAKYRDDKTNNAIQKLTFVTDEIRHGRFGSALTKVERASAAQYLPDPYDSREAMLRKSRGLSDLISLNNSRLKAKGAEAETGDLVDTGGPRPTSPSGASPIPGAAGWSVTTKP